ncbi:hypothetical protein FO519_003509 [Halicephalobus sp. NKZ332]|nr:hypothetical protein FO519_003509 [Halicephalobus sp. NKZ332]
MLARTPLAIKRETRDSEESTTAKIPKPIPVPIQQNLWNSIVPGNPQLFKPGNDILLEAFNAMLQSAAASLPNPGARQTSPDLYVDVCGNDSPSSNHSSVDVCSQASTTEASSSPSPRSISESSRRSSVSQDPSSKKPNLLLPPTRIYRRVTEDIRESDEYKTKRLRNNDAVRRSRENSKLKRETERHKFDELLQRYNTLLDHVKKCKCVKLPDFLNSEESK